MSMENRSMNSCSMENRSMENRNMENRSMENRNMENRNMENRNMENRNMNNRNMNNRSCQSARSREELMDIISKVSFAMDDTRLFLDTHPDCREAMEYFRKMHMIRREALKEYTERYGAICAYDMGPSDMWMWNAGKHPWLTDRKGGC